MFENPKYSTWARKVPTDVYPLAIALGASVGFVVYFANSKANDQHFTLRKDARMSFDEQFKYRENPHLSWFSRLKGKEWALFKGVSGYGDISGVQSSDISSIDPRSKEKSILVDVPLEDEEEEEGEEEEPAEEPSADDGAEPAADSGVESNVSSEEAEPISAAAVDESSVSEAVMEEAASDAPPAEEPEAPAEAEAPDSGPASEPASEPAPEPAAEPAVEPAAKPEPAAPVEEVVVAEAAEPVAAAAE
uniref:Uncharacterized protein n=1 Tax=Rhodosorus marinus TaxID=101924 RepID=A0A7S3A434_9RHOD|mmetsp:Transcript_44067/g.171960  ORF Transcript_44067/g.171960 Transcript_44067/m.171960 type:complete len:248 (+) Transcript_44067:283-1026(+)